MHTVRDLVFDDLDALLELYTHLHDSDAPLPDRPKVEAVWRQLCEDPRYICLGAVHESRVVAACHAAIVPNLTRGARPFAVIENVVTHSAYQRQGFGRAVISTMLDRCWARDCYKVILTSGFARQHVHAFYERLGFDKSDKQAFVAYSPGARASE